MTYKIEKAVPLPQDFAAGRPYNYPWKSMQPGDSFFLAGDKPKGLPGSASRYVKAQEARGETTRIVVRTVTENGVKGTRAWMVSREVKEGTA